MIRQRTSRIRLGAALAAVTLGATVLAACGSSGSSGSGSSGSKTLTVLYSNNYVFNSDALASQWWSGIAKQWKKLYPNVKLNLLGTGGTDVDLMNKAAVMFRSASTTPDVIQLPTTYVGEFAGSGYLLPLNSYVNGSSAPAFWTGMPKGVQQISTINGQVDAVNAGNNDSAILYNKPLLEKAGIKMPWQPKTWQDILTAAEAVKKADAGVWPLWMAAGVAAGPTNVLQGIGNLIDGSTNPVMFDTKTSKWVVNSPGLRATLQFYKTVSTEGLNAPTSQLFRTDSVGQPPLLMKQGKLAISIGSNWYPTVWVQSNSAAPWPQAKTDVGVAPVPTENGQGAGGASTIGGWAYAISKASTNDTMAWNFIKLAENPTNQLNTALWSGFVPPDLSVGEQTPFVSYAPPFQAAFNEYSKYGVPLPNNTNFTVYARALNTVTGDFAQNPNTSISSALATMSSLITQQLGSSSVETQP
ncbi:MAG TPA: extracellular solute-binding protein [Streptosporangiaceae bacterium]|nr:extracellular solute-binding protein [Streptosporangiaceae bacterium]